MLNIKVIKSKSKNGREYNNLIVYDGEIEIQVKPSFEKDNSLFAYLISKNTSK